MSFLLRVVREANLEAAFRSNYGNTKTELKYLISCRIDNDERWEVKNNYDSDTISRICVALLTPSQL
jgi:hypothetical protein